MADAQMELVDAAHAGDLEKVKQALANGANVNARTLKGELLPKSPSKSYVSTSSLS